MRIFHIATRADWESAKATGRYTTSTRGVTLAEEGFIHASRGDQWQAVRERYYADCGEPLVLLAIDPARLSSPVVEESAPDGETYPHIYGAIDPVAVVQVIDLDDPTPETSAPEAPMATAAADPSPAQPAASFSRIFFQEMFHNVVQACIVLACVVIGALVGQAYLGEWGPLLGTSIGVVAGIVLARLFGARRG